jgi:hypothetical protein
MKQPLPRILSAVPKTLHVQLEIAKAIRTLMASSDDEQLRGKVELTADQDDRALVAQFVREILLDLRKAGFNPDEPRVPAGNSKGGQWTTSDGHIISDAAPESLWRPGSLYAAISGPPGVGHNEGPPLEEPPPIPPRPPKTIRALNLFIKAAAFWLALAEKAAAARFFRLLQRVSWLARGLLYIRAYLSPPKTLKELQQDVANPQVGYDIHHVVEQTPARDSGFPDSKIDGPDNLVRIPTLKHRQITAWFQTRNEKYDGLSPRDYLRDKGWDERRRVGIEALIKFGVLKP